MQLICGLDSKDLFSIFQDEFTRWCFTTLESLGGSVDIPTFVAFLKDVESPFEVGDYVRSYLGEGKDARDFSKEFLERRSRWKNSVRNKEDGARGGSYYDSGDVGTGGGRGGTVGGAPSQSQGGNNDFQEVKVRSLHQLSSIFFHLVFPSLQLKFYICLLFTGQR